VGCPSDRYQPFAYSTNEINECIYMKSNCTEEGQIISDHGTGSSLPGDNSYVVLKHFMA
jgi:hypothetical protein